VRYTAAVSLDAQVAINCTLENQQSARAYDNAPLKSFPKAKRAVADNEKIGIPFFREKQIQ